MNNEKKDNSFEPEDILSTNTGSKLETTKLPEAGPENTVPAAPIAAEAPQAVEAIEQPVELDGSHSSSVDRELRTGEAASSVAAKQGMSEAGPEDAKLPTSIVIETDWDVEAIEQQVDAEGASSSVEPALRADEVVPLIAVEPVFVKKPLSFFEEPHPPRIEMAPRGLTLSNPA
jgi:hypothetical protein